MNKSVLAGISMIGLVYGVERHFFFIKYSNYIAAASFIGGGKRTSRRKPSTCRKSLTNLSNNVISSAPRLNGIPTHIVSGNMH
jgi:hypothetical protein